MRMTMEGLRAPELVGEEEDWINSDPIRLRNLDRNDNIVLLDIFDYTCMNCTKTIPYIKEWYKRYSDMGLVVIGIHTPEFEFARYRKNVEEGIQLLGIEYPVLLDSDRINWYNYANRYWPRKLLIDQDRRIVYDRIGEGGYSEMETAIQAQIRNLFPNAVLPPLMKPVRPEDEPEAICYPTTRETFTGFYRGIIGNPEGYRPNEPHTYADPGDRRDGVIYLRGEWLATADSIRHARETHDPEDYIALQYHAAEVNAVISPEHSSEFDVLITQDGRPLAQEDAGDDVLFTSGGEAVLHVDKPRMYKLVKNSEFGSHELRLSCTSDAFSIFSFTFGSCTEPGS